MICPKCNSTTKVVDSRSPKVDEDGLPVVDYKILQDGLEIQEVFDNYRVRTRQCKWCKHKFTSVEVELTKLVEILFSRENSKVVQEEDPRIQEVFKIFNNLKFVLGKEKQ